MDLRDPATLVSMSKNVKRPSVPIRVKTLYRGEPMALGITQILIGVVEFAFGLVLAMLDYDVFYYSHSHLRTPFWLGILYIISGSLSVAVAKNPKIPLVKGMLGMNVVSTVAASIGIILLSILITDPVYYYICEPDDIRNTQPELCHEFIAISYFQILDISTVLLVFTILEVLIAITTAAFGCATLCRNSFSETTVVIFQNAAQEAPHPRVPAIVTPVKEDETL
uniref:membrane-spanning 4-domains subfamily A member 12-like n=1 Tax=Euleptes europaea TaxID=460621 RepID=UPI00253FC604|nr:membrane-spanning 4-domains subfamily A member 12-like [Euleptes europaea]